MKLLRKLQSGYIIKRKGDKVWLEPGHQVYNRLYQSTKDMNLLGTEVKAGDYYKIVKDNAGNVKCIVTDKINPREQDTVETLSDFNRALSYVTKYRNSEGFKLRLSNLQLPNNITLELRPIVKPKLILNPRYQAKVSGANINNSNAIAHYNWNTNEVHSNYFNRSYTIPHELGHWLDAMLLPDTKFLIDKAWNKQPYSYTSGAVTYSSLWPELKDNIYNSVYNYKNVGPQSKVQLEQYEHDARPSELYAQLMAFRLFLEDNNIYSSTKANNVFTKDHLNKVLSLDHIPEQIKKFIYLYTPDTLVKVMNTVASNNLNNTKNLIYYG